jgi:uncharacterized damage-inducible protein DinB
MNELIIGREAGGLVDMLRYARRMTIRAVDGLTTAQLDHRFDAESNSIGALLMHIVAVEISYQLDTFEGRDWTPDEAAQWKPWANLGPASEQPIGQPLDHYLELLGSIRERTELELLARDEEWLFLESPFGKTVANNYWKWFHVCEHEINHRGQIRWLRSRAR